jgi:hypothetical protein
MRVDFPFPTWIAAEEYLDKYGPPSRYDWTRWIDRVDVPVLLIFGERELQTNAAFLGILDEVKRLRGSCPRMNSREIPGADHFYGVRRHVVSKAICQWLLDLPSA